MKQQSQTVRSPDGNVEIVFDIRPGLILYLKAEGCPYYTLRYRGVDLIEPSQLGLRLAGAAELTSNFALREATRAGCRICGNGSVGVPPLRHQRIDMVGSHAARHAHRHDTRPLGGGERRQQ